MQNFIGKKVLITTSAFFYGKDGKEYRAVHGTLKAIHEAGKTLGFIPNRSHANWFIEIGDMIIMGCQVMYVQQVDEVNNNSVDAWNIDGGKFLSYKRPTTIYVTI